jgi:hypothetical protein
VPFGLVVPPPPPPSEVIDEKTESVPLSPVAEESFPAPPPPIVTVYELPCATEKFVAVLYPPAPPAP